MNVFKGYPRFIFTIRFLQLMMAVIGLGTIIASAILIVEGVEINWMQTAQNIILAFGVFFGSEWLLKNKPELFFGNDWRKS